MWQVAAGKSGVWAILVARRSFLILALAILGHKLAKGMPEKQAFHKSSAGELRPFPESDSYSSIGLRTDCLHNFNADPGSAQDCMAVSGLRLSLREDYQSGLHGRLTLNPFASLSRHLDKRPFMSEKPLVRDSELGIIESFQVEWLIRPRLALGIGLYDGAAWYPDYSGLPHGASFYDSGWKQIALSATYFLSILEGVRVRFVGGNGEGELLGNHNPQQYFGFEFKGEVTPGVELHSGLSTSGNLKNSALWDWSRKYFRQACGIDFASSHDSGWAVRRMSIGLGTNGYLPFAHGLKIGLGWHRSLFTQNDKDKPDQPTIAQLATCSRIDPELLLIEDPDRSDVNSMEHIVTGINASYRILDRWFIGFDYESRRIRSEIPFFRTCVSYLNGQCQGPSAAENSLKQRAWSVGAGTDLTEGLSLILAYNSTTYSELYEKIYFIGRGKEPARTRDLFTLRISYNWLDY